MKIWKNVEDNLEKFGLNLELNSEKNWENLEEIFLNFRKI